MNIDEMKNRISMALKDPILQQGFEIICKENAGLDMKRKAERKIFQGIVEKKNDQLIKAKKIIKNLMLFAAMDFREYEEEYKEAEQFLKDLEK